METVKAGTFSFGEYVLDTSRRRLSRSGEPVTLYPKAFDLLVHLIENRGSVLSKDDLLEHVWPGQFVEENNLTVQMSALRKVFGDRNGSSKFIATVPGRGYSFVADLTDETHGQIIESHSLSRILIDETIEVDTEKDATFRQTSPSSGRRLSASQKMGGLIFIGILVLGGVAGGIYSSRSWILNEQASTAKTSERQLAAKVFTTAGGGVPNRVAISSDGKTIAYVERLKSQSSLRLGEIENNNSVEIVSYSDRVYNYLAFAPDGKNIYFTARDSSDRGPALMRVSAFGGAVQYLISEVNSFITFSPDGKSLAFMRGDRNGDRTSMIIADAETGKDQRVLTVREKPENVVGSGISWSPDGQMIAFAASDTNEEGSALWAVNTADGSISRIGDAVENRIVNIVWVADGGGLIVNRNSSNDAGDGKIWFVPYPRGEARQITNDTFGYSVFSLGVSLDNKLAVMHERSDPQIRMAPDGDLQNSRNILGGARSRAEGKHGLAAAPDGKILFTASANGSRTIWEMDAGGGSQRQLTASQKDVEDRQIGVTADNRFLVFDSNRSGSSEIWRANRDGSDLIPLTSGGGNIQPVVSPNGSWVVYTAASEGKHGLRRVSIEGGEPIQITTEKKFWPAISPDGRYIAFAQSRSDANPYQVISIIPFDGGAAIKTFEVPVSSVLYNRLRWSPDGKAIVYKDNFQGLWQQDLSKDKPEPVNSPDELRIYHFAYSADGTLIYSGGTPMREIVILENLR